MIIKKIKKNKGFVILFAVMLSSILLAIALGVSNIAFREVTFGTSAKDANDAFFAADVGAECALFYDKSLPANNAFTVGQSFAGPMNCAGSHVALVGDTGPSWSFDVVGLGSNGKSCAKVTVDKSIEPITIISKGYSSDNIGDTSCTPLSNSLERELEVTYE